MHRTTSVSECMNTHVYPQAYKHELFFQIKPHPRNLNSSSSTQVFLHLYQFTSRTKNSQKCTKIPITKVIGKLHKGYTNKGGTRNLHLKSCAQPAQAR